MDISLIILGIVQGLTEFLPISSSGHLTIVSYLLHRQLPLALEILLHLATLCAVIIYTFPLIKPMLIALYRSTLKRTAYHIHTLETLQKDRNYISLMLCICLSTVTTIPMGLFLKDTLESFSVSFVGIMLLSTAVFLLIPFLIPSKRLAIAKSVAHRSTDIFPKISYVQAMLLGIAQGFAIFPGVSRSGITITFAVLLGLSFQHAAYYSFLMAIPAILASFVLSIADLPELMNTISYVDLIVTMLVTFVTGLIGLRLLSLISTQGKIWVFSIYLFIVGFLLLAL